MSFTQFGQLVTSEEDVARLLGVPGDLVIKKQLTQLDAHMQRFLSEAPFVVVGTIGSDGRCDVSPRGDAAPVARVLDPHSLLIPDRPGNRRADSIRNIVATNRIGLLFMIPGLGETLRINGNACVTCDKNLLQTVFQDEKVPELAIGVDVEECYLQCAKAFIRSHLWQGQTKHPQANAQHFAAVLAEQTGLESESTATLAEQIERSYKERLY